VRAARPLALARAQASGRLAVLADVQAEGRLVALHRFEIVDDVVAGTDRCRHPHAVAQFAHHEVRLELAQLRLERGPLVGLDEAVEIEGADVGVTLQQRRREIVELRPSDGLHGREQLVGDVQDFDGLVHALAQRGDAYGRALFERQRLVAVFEAADGSRQHDGCDDATSEREGCRKRERKRQSATRHPVFPMHEDK